MIPNDLHYQFPIAAYLFFGSVALLFLFWMLYLYRRRDLERFAPAAALKEILVPRSLFQFWAKVVALCFAWVFAVAALMEPVGNGHYPAESGQDHRKKSEKDEKEVIFKRKAQDVIFLIDASASMEVKDTRLGISRLDFAKDVIDQTISRLKGESIALYAFTSDTTKLSPPTMDYVFVRLVLRQVKINEGDIAGTNMVEAVADMRDAYFAKPTPKLKTIVFVTDGGDTQLEGMQGGERENQIMAILALLNDAEKNQLRVVSIGMGTKSGAEIPGLMYQGKPVVATLDEELLKRMSEKGRGTYYFANDWTALDLGSVLARDIEQQGAPIEEYKLKGGDQEAKGGEDLVYDLLFQFPLGAAMILLGFVLFFPDTRLRNERL